MFYTKGKVDIKNSDFLTKHVIAPENVAKSGEDLCLERGVKL